MDNCSTVVGKTCSINQRPFVTFVTACPTFSGRTLLLNHYLIYLCTRRSVKKIFAEIQIIFYKLHFQKSTDETLPTEEDMSFIDKELNDSGSEDKEISSERDNSEESIERAATLSDDNTNRPDQINHNESETSVDEKSDNTYVVPERTPEPPKKRRKIVPDDD